MDTVSSAVEQCRGQYTDATGCSGHGDRPERRVLTVFLHAQQSQPGGESGGTENHGFAWAPRFGNMDDMPVIDAHFVAVAAVGCFRQTGAGHQHSIAGFQRRICRLDDMSGAVNAAVEREAPQNFTLTGAGQRVLVIDAGVLDGDHCVARRQHITGDRLDAGTITGGIIVNPEGWKTDVGTHHNLLGTMEKKKPA